MMITTTEVRWFFPGTVPAEVWEWFRRGDHCVQQPDRTDAYLVLPGCSTAGIKLREGRLETKMQTERPAAIDYPGGVSGYVDSWVKWSRSAGLSREARTFLSAEGEEWVDVGKRRAVRAFSLDGTGTGIEGDPLEGQPVGIGIEEVDCRGARPEHGCGLELTELVVLEPNESNWWTLGLEGFDEDGDPASCLDRVARHLFAGSPPPVDVGLDASCSYAAWLGSGVWRG